MHRTGDPQVVLRPGVLRTTYPPYESLPYDVLAPLVAEANQHAHEAVLEPGEALYLPKKYWHHCRTLTVSMCVNFWWL